MRYTFLEEILLSVHLITIISSYYVRSHSQVHIFKSGYKPKKLKAIMNSKFGALSWASNDVMTSRINPKVYLNQSNNFPNPACENTTSCKHK